MKTHFFYLFLFQGNSEARTEEENDQIFLLLYNLGFLFEQAHNDLDAALDCVLKHFMTFVSNTLVKAMNHFHLLD